MPAVDAAVDGGFKPAVLGEYSATKGKSQLVTFNASKAAIGLEIDYTDSQTMIKDVMTYFNGFL